MMHVSLATSDAITFCSPKYMELANTWKLLYIFLLSVVCGAGARERSEPLGPTTTHRH